ncbi:MAG: OB-fold domain-containing protein [Actinobacteria bacterium]|nr:OB-fold domain-containing protein [Actinomycetota bacterium]
MPGIVAYGTYIPYWRLERSRIAQALGTGAGAGTRAVASYDEDATSMGVEAARAALAVAAGRPGDHAIKEVVFVTTAPPYLDKTNATAIHAALGLAQNVPAFDAIGSVRSAAGATKFAGDGTLLVLSDIRTGLPGSTDEAQGGDAAAAFLFGEGDDVIAERIGFGSSTAEFLDRWRVPGDNYSHQWEERFGEAAYVPLAEAALADSLKSAGISREDVDHFLAVGLHARAVRGFKSAVDLTPSIGNSGAAAAGLVLSDVLDRAKPGDLIARLIISDGADCSVWRVTDAITSYRRHTTVADQIAVGRDDLDYAKFLTWRGFLDREPPRRPDPERPAAPPSFRRDDWKFGFTASRCTACETRHLPPSRVCVKCNAVDEMVPERLADVKATIATFTVDRLAYSLSPPIVAAVIDFDGGGRFRCELTDVDPATVKIGDRVEMTFRRLFTAGGVHNYFWKAKPITKQGDS